MGRALRQGVLLDTHAAIWLTTGSPLRPTGLQAYVDAREHGERICVSALSAWEIAMLASTSRIELPTEPLAWFVGLTETMGAKRLDLTPEILVGAVLLPRWGRGGDPADRMIAATARAHGLTLITRDRRLLDYAAAGFIDAVAC